MFESGRQEFKCEIALFRKLPGTDSYRQQVRDDVSVDLGEEVQLASRVRAGDGKISF